MKDKQLVKIEDSDVIGMVEGDQPCSVEDQQQDGPMTTDWCSCTLPKAVQLA